MLSTGWPVHEYQRRVLMPDGDRSAVKGHDVARLKFVCKFAQQQPPPHHSGRTVLALQKRRCYTPAPNGAATPPHPWGPDAMGGTYRTTGKWSVHARTPMERQEQTTLMGPANRDANREPGASPRAKTPTVSEFSWYKNGYIFVRFWAIWGLDLGVATIAGRQCSN